MYQNKYFNISYAPVTSTSISKLSTIEVASSDSRADVALGYGSHVSTFRSVKEEAHVTVKFSPLLDKWPLSQVTTCVGSHRVRTKPDVSLLIIVNSGHAIGVVPIQQG